MKRLKIYTLLLYSVAFLLPILLLSVVFYMANIYPFGNGNKIVLVVDLFTQYMHYYSYFLDAIQGKESFLYSWHAGLGSNFVGNIAYYSASPLLFILLAFPKEFLPEGVLILILIKLGLCGVTSCYFISKKFTALRYDERVFFSAFYSLMSFNVTYYYNVMWLDSIILLPLLVLAIDSLIKHNKWYPFLLLFSLTIIVNFYISFMIGLFIFIYFILSLFVLKNQKPKEFGKKATFVFIKSTLLSIGLSSFLTIPTFFQLLASLGYEESPYSQTITLNYVFKLFIGVFDSIKNGSPNIYIGTFVLLLVPSFFLVKIDRQEKVKWFFLLLIIAISFFVPTLNLLWHASDSPNWFPFRNSFLFSFVLFYMSLVAYVNIHTVSIKKLISVFIGSLLFLTGAELFSEQSFNLVINLCSICLFFLIIIIKKYNYKKITFFAFCLYAFTGLFFNTTSVLLGLYNEVGLIEREHYQIYNPYRTIITTIKNTDTSPFYRIETDVNQTNNDSLLLGHSSLSHSSSLLQNELISTLQSFGFTTYKASYNDVGSTFITKSILGIKYYVSSTALPKAEYELISKLNDLSIYKNKYYLPIGFLVDDRITDLNIRDYKDPFILHNKMYQTMFLTEETLFEPHFPLKTEVKNATIEKQNKGKKLIRIHNRQPMILTYSFNLDQSSSLYGFFQVSHLKAIKIYLNNEEIEKYSNLALKGILEMGTFDKEKLVLKLVVDEDEITFIRDELFYRIPDSNLVKFQNSIQSVDRDAFKLTFLKGNELEASVVSKHDDSLLFLSIPWDEGWNIRVNGKKVMPKKVLNSFMGIPLDKGEHTLHLHYVPKGLLVGSVISLLSFLTCLILVVVHIKQRKDRKHDNSFEL